MPQEQRPLQSKSAQVSYLFWNVVDVKSICVFWLGACHGRLFPSALSGPSATTGSGKRLRMQKAGGPLGSPQGVVRGESPRGGSFKRT